MPNDSNVRAVERALNILDCFSGTADNFTLSEIAHKVDLTPSTTLRILSTLENQNYLHRDSKTSRYYLGYKLIQISDKAYSNLDICRVSAPYLEELNARFHESVGIYVLREKKRMCVARINGSHPLQSVLQVGDIRSISNGGASSTVILAYQSDEFLKDLIVHTPRYTPEYLAGIREQGYAISYGETVPGIVSAATPIFNVKKELAGALIITAPDARVSEEKAQEFISAAKEAANSISIEMGYRE